MEKNSYIWTKEGYIGCNMLHSNYKDSNHKVVFAGAKRLNEDKWKVNFIFSYTSSSQGNFGGGGYGPRVSIVVTPNEKIRFESYFGITEEISVQCRPEEHMNCSRFFPIEFIRFVYIEKDYIKYEVHCI